MTQPASDLLFRDASDEGASVTAAPESAARGTDTLTEIAMELKAIRALLERLSADQISFSES